MFYQPVHCEAVVAMYRHPGEDCVNVREGKRTLHKFANTLKPFANVHEISSRCTEDLKSLQISLKHLLSEFETRKDAGDPLKRLCGEHKICMRLLQIQYAQCA